MSLKDEDRLEGEPAPELVEGRIWVDGCFDFFHHGHAGAIVQARQLGTELYAGVHSDEAILANKGPTVMTLDERHVFFFFFIRPPTLPQCCSRSPPKVLGANLSVNNSLAATNACRWVTRSVGHAPYVTSLPYITHYGCKYVVHGDDITSDSDGNDCYRFVKEAGRFKVVKRSPAISTTDLVGRMLLCTKTHHMRSLERVLRGEEGAGTEEERKALGQSMMDRIRLYATDETAAAPGADVWFWSASVQAKAEDVAAADQEEKGTFRQLLAGRGPQPGQRVVYVDGGYDLFCSGHIEFLRLVLEAEEELARKDGWYSEQAVNERKGKGRDYGPAFVVVGVHDDEVINMWKGVNYPIMNIFERGLCVLQCKYIDAVIFGAPFTPTKTYLTSLPWGTPDAVYHGATSFIPLTYDPYTGPKELGIYRQIGEHAFSHVNAGQIVQRIMKSRDMYEARQRAKGVKAGLEAAVRQRELLEEEQRRKEAERAS